MKNAFFVLMAGALLVSCNQPVTFTSPDGALPSQYVAYAKPFVGNYQTQDGGMVQVALQGDHLTLTTNFDVTATNCGTQIGALEDVNVYPNQNGTVDMTAPFGADFALDTGNCLWLPEHFVTFHFNRALTGADVYELSVLLRFGIQDSQNSQPDEYQNWILKRVQ